MYRLYINESMSYKKAIQTIRQIDISRNLNTPSYLQIRMCLNANYLSNLNVKTQQSGVILTV
jgi:hypothetical protein